MSPERSLLLSLAALAIATLAAWIALYLRAASACRAPEPGPDGAARARGLNLAFLAATLAASFASCAAPIVPLVAGFHAVAEAPPAEKADLLRAIIERDRPLMPLALVGIVALGAGLGRFRSNSRLMRRGARVSAAR